MIDVLNMKIVAVIDPGAIVDDADFTSIEIDGLNVGHVTVVLRTGAMDIAMAILKLVESDTPADAGATAVPAADFSVSPATLPSATGDNKFYAIQVPMLGRKRYLTLKAKGGNGSAGTYAYAFAILSDLSQAPYGATKRGFTQELTAG